MAQGPRSDAWVSIDRKDLDRAVAAGVLSPAQADALWESLSARPAPAPAPALAPVPPLHAAAAAALGLAAAGGAVWLLLLAWERFGGAGGFALAVAYGLALAKAAAWVSRRSYGAAGGVLAAAAVAMVPAAVHGLQHWLGVAADPAAPADTVAAWIRSHAFPPALAAVVASALALRVLSLPFLSAVTVAAAWFLALDAAPLLFGPAPSWNQHALLSSLVGLVALGVGLAVDGRTRRDHAQWLYLAGLVAFWGGLTTFHADSGASAALGAFVNAALVLTGLLLSRRAFAVFGAVGLAGVAGHLAAEILVDAVLPFALAAIALAVAGAGVAYHRLEAEWSRALVARFPAGLRRLLPPLGARR